jgi:sensor histidine kinase YesM
MLPFLENAFKHGVSQHTENSFIYVDLKVKEQNLTFRVENSSINSESDLEADYTKGIGLKNVKRRLDLIYGDDGYNLEVFKEEDSFTIVLKTHQKLFSLQPTETTRLKPLTWMQWTTF